MDLEEEFATPLHHIVTPGELITDDTQYMRGHGTYSEDNKLWASVAGVVERVNKLISVKPLRSRYNPDIGDLVVGRITSCGQRSWKVDIGTKQDSILQLASITIPGVQRRRTEEEQVEIRTFFREGDMVCAEIQSFFSDGSAALQTRSTKFGKLRNGSLILVPPTLVKRCKSHFHTLPCGVDLILGLNGFIWVCLQSTPPKDSNLDAHHLYTNQNEPISMQVRETIARVSNCIAILAKHYLYINDSIILATYQASLSHPIVNLLDERIMESVVEKAKLTEPAFIQKPK